MSQLNLRLVYFACGRRKAELRRLKATGAAAEGTRSACVTKH